MAEIAAALSVLAWIVFGVVWIAMAKNVKATDRVESIASRAGHLVPLFFAFALLFTRMPESLEVMNRRFEGSNVVLVALGAVLTAGGIAFAIWARITLGRNWSASVMQKSDHELIVSGPFRYVRHPIYTGMLAGMLGSAVLIGEWRGLLALVITWLTFWRKYRLEERFMTERFAERYLEYRQRVPALIPTPSSMRSANP